MNSNEELSSQLWTQFMQLRKEAWKKKTFRQNTGVSERAVLRNKTNMFWTL